MDPVPSPSDPHRSAVIVNGRHPPAAIAVTGSSSPGSDTSTTDAYDVLHQQRWDPAGRFHEADLSIDCGTTTAQMFDRYVDLYHRVAEQADGIPAPGQSRLPRVS